MDNFLCRLLSIVQVLGLLIFAWYLYSFYGAYQRYQVEEPMSSEAAARLIVQDLVKYGRVLPNWERIQNQMVEDTLTVAKDAEKVLADVGSKLVELRVPDDDVLLDTVFMGVVTDADQHIDNFVPAGKDAVAEYAEFENLVIGRASRPSQSSLPKGFVSGGPAAFFVGTAGKQVTNKVYLLAKCDELSSDMANPLWVYDTVWKPATGTMLKYSYSVTKQACGLVYHL